MCSAISVKMHCKSEQVFSERSLSAMGGMAMLGQKHM